MKACRLGSARLATVNETIKIAIDLRDDDSFPYDGLRRTHRQIFEEIVKDTKILGLLEQISAIHHGGEHD
jgi:hypothetical protein